MTQPTDAVHTVIYDGDCAACQRFIDYLRRSDPEGVLELVAFQEPGVRARFPWIAPDRLEEALQLVEPGPDATPRKTWEGARAIEELTRVVPRYRGVSWIFDLPRMRPLLAWGYRHFARNRRRFGCGDHCSVGPARK